MKIATIKWSGGIDGFVELIDQTQLPGKVEILPIRDQQAMWQAIRKLQIRGAPAIGVAAAYGVVLAASQLKNGATIDPDGIYVQIEQICDYLATSRPTAVNLFWALDRMKHTARTYLNDYIRGGANNTSNISTTDMIRGLRERLLAEAQAIRDEDAAMCRAIGQNGAHLITAGSTVLTHCNAGALATADYGTALAVMFAAHENGVPFSVYADETRPLLQGARLTTWELMQAGIDVTLICDNMAASLMGQGKIDLIITGADRIAANGDTANKIGTYGLAVLARAHNIPFYIAAPYSTFDFSVASGSEIPIESRPPEEVSEPFGYRVAPAGVKVYNPAFDVTPHGYITGFITEKGVFDSHKIDSVNN